MKGNRAKWDMMKYCCYHKDHRNITEEYRQLKDEIEGLISRWYLRQYVKNRVDQYPWNNYNDRAQAPNPQPQGGQAPIDENMPPPIEGEDIITIAGGPHLATTEHAISSVLVREDGKQHKSVEYMRKRLLGAESRYPSF